MTRSVRIGSVTIGGGNPVAVQSMCSTHTRDVAATVAQINALKDSHPARVVELNTRFSAQRPDIPLHLGVTEAGMPPEGVVKTRLALEPLIGKGLGATLRVSLTLPTDRKAEEVLIGRRILADIAAGRVLNVVDHNHTGLNIISCPSCSRVENEQFIALAGQLKELTRYAADLPISIAVMGCRVNGPGETTDADLGLWCGPRHVNFLRRGEHLGAFPYDEILTRVREELDSLLSSHPPEKQPIDAWCRHAPE